MAGLLSVFAVLISIIFVIIPIVLTVSIANRYRKAERAIDHYTALVRALIAFIEREEYPEAEAAAAAAEESEPSPTFLNRLLDAWRGGVRSAPRVVEYRLKDEFEDYLAVIRQGESESGRYIRFKRKNLNMQQALTEDLEFCRTYTETLPYLGILGTVLGFFLSPAVFAPGAASAANVGGLVLALSSTAAALACILVIKLFYENVVIPQYLEFADALAAVDDYIGRYGEFASENGHKAVA